MQGPYKGLPNFGFERAEMNVNRKTETLTPYKNSGEFLKTCTMHNQRFGLSMDVCMVQSTLRCKRKREESSDLNTGAWTAQEDSVLVDYVETHGKGKWCKVSKETGPKSQKRCKKSCRVRGNISPEEEDLILRLHKLLGNRWSLIAGRLPGRTDIEIKNHWNTVIRRKIMNSKKQCKSENNIQNKNPFDEGSFHLLMTDSDAVCMNPANLMEVGNTVLKQSQNAENIGTDSDAEPTQDGNSGNGNVVVELKLSSDASISSTEGNSQDYITGCYLEQLLRSDIPALEFWKLCNFGNDTSIGIKYK